MEKQEILALAKELAESDDLSARIADVKIVLGAGKMFRHDDEVMAGNEDADKYEEYRKAIKDKEKEGFAKLYEDKKAMVKKAQELLTSTNIKKANDEMTKIIDEVKAMGRCSKEQDDEVWADLKKARSEFSQIKKTYYTDLRAKFEASKVAKEALIEKAKLAAAKENMKEANAELTSIMEEWKKAGFAGKEKDDALWEEFNAIRQEFFKKRKDYYEGMEKTFQERVAKKEELVKKAKLILANSEFVPEEIEEIKKLRQAWKEVGFAGKAKDEELWNEFNTALNKYFDEKRNNY